MHATGNINYTWLLQVTGTPEPASRFEVWTGDSPSSSSNPVVVTMSADKAVTGEFAEIATLRVTTNATDVLPEVMSLETPPILVVDPLSTGVYYAPAGDEVEVETPARMSSVTSHMAFIRWEDEEAELLDTDSTTTVLMGAEPVLHAKYGDELMLTAKAVNLPAGGTVHGTLDTAVVLNAAEGYAAYDTPSTEVAGEVTYFYPAGTILEFTAAPDEDYCLHPWLTDIAGFCATGSTVELPPLTQAIDITAAFSLCQTLSTEVLGPTSLAEITVAMANEGKANFCPVAGESPYGLAGIAELASEGESEGEIEERKVKDPNVQLTATEVVLPEEEEDLKLPPFFGQVLSKDSPGCIGGSAPRTMSVEESRLWVRSVRTTRRNSRPR